MLIKPMVLHCAITNY